MRPSTSKHADDRPLNRHDHVAGAPPELVLGRRRDWRAALSGGRRTFGSATRTAFAGILIAGLLLTVLAGQIVDAERAGKDAMFDRYTARAVLAEKFVEAYIADLQRRVLARAEIALSGNAPTAEEVASTANILEFEAAVLLNGDGHLLQVFPDKPELAGQDMGTRHEHLRQAIRGQPAVSIVVLSAVTSDPIVAFAVPFDTPYGRRVFSGEFDVTKTPLAAFLENTSPIAGSNVHVVDSAGILVAADDTDDNGGALSDHDVALRDALGGPSRKAATGTFDRDGVQTFFTSRTIRNAPWRIVFDAPADALFAPLEAGRGGPWNMFAAFAARSLLSVVLMTRAVHQRQGFAHAAEADGLTGVANRRYLDRQLAHLSIRPDNDFAVLMVDIDHFKTVNDRFGHQRGDVVLRRTASVIDGSIRPSDILGRWGGEEFMVLLPGTDLPGCVIVAERIRSNVARAALADDDLSITVSIGAATHGGDSGTVVGRADVALYRAKAEGRNRVVIDQVPVPFV